MLMQSGQWAGALAAAALVCAAPAALADPIQPGQEPAFSLGLLGPHIPDVLKRAVADPYAPPAEPACTTLPQELAELDALLGPDMNQPKPKTFSPTMFVGHAVRSAIPYRSAIRFITGADRKEKKLNQAAMAGWARRGFLKGLAAKLDCPSPTQTAQDSAPPPDAASAAQPAAAQVAAPAQGPAPAPATPFEAPVQAPVLIPAADSGPLR